MERIVLGTSDTLMRRFLRLDSYIDSYEAVMAYKASDGSKK